MPLSKFPIEVPLGGAVDEGNVPEIVQPPRIREATDCASIKGGAYTKKDGQQLLEGPGAPVPADGLAVERDGEATVVLRSTAVRRLRDDGGVSDSYPSPVTGRPVRGFYPTEADGLKQSGDHATLTLPDGRLRTLAAWDVCDSGTYEMENFKRPPPATNPESQTPNPNMWGQNRGASITWQYGSGARYALFDGSVQDGPERGYESITAAQIPPASNWSEGAVMGFPRVRAGQTQQVFWSACAVAIGTSINGRHFHLSTKPAYPGGGSALLYPYERRDILNTVPNFMNADGATPRSNGCKLFVHDADGEVIAAAVCEQGSVGLPASPALPPALELVVVEDDGSGDSKAYTLHPVTTVPPAATQCVIRRWRFLGNAILSETVGVFSPPPQTVPPVGAQSPYAWPAGLHDMGAGRLMLVWSDTSLTIMDYDLVTISEREAGFILGNVAYTEDPLDPDQSVRQTLSGQYGNFARLSLERTLPVPGGGSDRTFTQTAWLTRGHWAGSFLAPDQGGAQGADSQYWLGIQIVNDGYGDGPIAINNQYVITRFAPTGAVFYSGSVIHALVDRDGVVQTNGLLTEDGDPVSSLSVMPGCAIATQGAYVEGAGAVAGIYASAPGDTRTSVATKMNTAVMDVPTTTFLLMTRRVIPEMVDVPVEFPMNPDPRVSAGGTSASNQPVSIAQVLPQGQSLGTYMVNPYQVRTNLDVDIDGGVRFMCFERRGAAYFQTDAYGGVGTDAFDSFERPCGDATLAAPYLLTLSPDSDAQAVQARGYVCADGAHPVSIGGPQGLTGGFGVQPTFDVGVMENEFQKLLGTGDDEWTYVANPSTVTAGALPGQPGEYAVFILGGEPDTPGSLYGVATHLVTEDEDGGQHRSVPMRGEGIQAWSRYSADGDVNPEGQPGSLNVAIYPFPLCAFGIPNSLRAYVELYASGPGSAPLREMTARYRVPLTGFRLWLGDDDVLYPVQGTEITPSVGNGQALYTDSGELAADAPDPSAALASARSRVWSVSLLRPQTVQYSKLLRVGYAPEWNGNLTVSVPDAPSGLTAVAVLPDGRVLIFSPTSIHYTYGEGPSDAGQGAGFAEPALLSDTVGCANKRAVVTGDFGCIFQGDRGFYRVDRQLSLSYIGLPYEDTAVGGVYAAATDGYRSEVIFYSDVIGPSTEQQRWVYNYLRDQWSTFENSDVARSACEREARPLTYIPATQEIQVPTRDPASIGLVGTVQTDLMSLTTGWLAMGKIQGYGRTWEVQLTGVRDPASLSGLRVEIFYDYIDAPAETFTFDDVGAGQFKVRFRPRKQKSEAISFRFQEYLPIPDPPAPPVDPAQCTGWRLDMCTLLVGVKAGLDKVPVTVRST